MSTILGGDVVACTSIAGGAAGPHPVPGIDGGCELLAVIRHSADLQTRADDFAEYSIASPGVIDNTGGTSSAGQLLAVLWRRPD